mgnify:CR=1 FL=1|tara:strand:+ start:467 stop:1630 length:1164 start_codon:yes stop_codon:yes gene_type:complete
MNRTLKRPMFRMGGSTGTGITSGLNRQNYKIGGGAGMARDNIRLSDLPFMKTQNTPTVDDKSVPKTSFLNPEGVGLGMGTLPGFLTQFGLNLVSATPRGNIFATAAESAKEPFSRFQAAKFKEKQSEDEFKKDLALALAKPQKQTLRQAVNKQTGERGFYTDTEIMNDPNLVPPDNRMAFKFNANTKSFEQVPISDIERGKDDQITARNIGTQYNILSALTKDMQLRLPGTTTGFTGGFFQFLEGAADQFRQLGSSYGIANGLTEDFDESKIDEYLESTGATKLASNYATMKGSVINLGYALAKIAEPDNPRLSEGDIIRQLNRINFGASRKIFKDSLDQILKEENIRASATIKGLELDPNNFIGVEKKEENKKNEKGKDFDPLKIL